MATYFASVRSLVASLKTVVLDGEVVLITPNKAKTLVERAGGVRQRRERSTHKH